MAHRVKYTVTKNEAGMRLDIFIYAHNEEFSRAWIQKLIKKGGVSVEGERRSASYKVSAGERVSLIKEFPEELSLEAELNVRPAPVVIFEHQDFIIFDKPSGLVVHPAVSTPRGTLVNWLLANYPEVGEIGENAVGRGQKNLRPGIVHRLDKDTSGVMVVARTQKMFEWLKGEFKKRHVNKTYTALVLGTPSQDVGRVTFPIGRAKTDPTKQRVYRSPQQTPSSARPAETRWRLLKQFADTALLEITPVTGRKHQIRVHMSAVGHPVAGDKKYARKGMKSPKHVGRLFLHASALSFSGPHGHRTSGEKFTFTSPLPPSLQSALKNLPFVVE